MMKVYKTPHIQSLIDTFLLENERHGSRNAPGIDDSKKTSETSDQQETQESEYSIMVESARRMTCADSIEWNDIKRLYLNSGYQDKGVGLKEICRGGGLDLDSFYNDSIHAVSKPNGKTPELVAHLESLQRKLDQQRYDTMVKDVTEAERRAKEAADSSLVTYKDQLRFGVHVITMMGAFFVFGYVGSGSMVSSLPLRLVSGIVCMTAAMVMETMLYMIKTSKQDANNRPHQQTHVARHFQKDKDI